MKLDVPRRQLAHNLYSKTHQIMKSNLNSLCLPGDDPKHWTTSRPLRWYPLIILKSRKAIIECDIVMGSDKAQS